MTQYLIDAYKITNEQLEELVFITFKNMNIYRGNGQQWELSPSKKTIYIVQYDKGQEIGRKGFRVSSCLFFNELYD